MKKKSYNGQNGQRRLFEEGDPYPQGQWEGLVRKGQMAKLYLSTTTNEKVHELDMIALANRWPLRVLPFAAVTELVHSPEEDSGSFSGNAGIKSKSSVRGFVHYHGQLNNGEAYVKHYVDNLGHNRNSPIFLGTEDSGVNFLVPPQLFDGITVTREGQYFSIHISEHSTFDWTGVKKHMHKLVKQAISNILEQSQDNFEAVTSEAVHEQLSFIFPGVETGPIIRDIGGEKEFMKRLKSGLDTLARQWAMDNNEVTEEAEWEKVRWEQPVVFTMSSTLQISKVKPNFKRGKSGADAEDLPPITRAVTGNLRFDCVPKDRMASTDDYYHPHIDLTLLDGREITDEQRREIEDAMSAGAVVSSLDANGQIYSRFLGTRYLVLKDLAENYASLFTGMSEKKVKESLHQKDFSVCRIDENATAHVNGSGKTVEMGNRFRMDDIRKLIQQNDAFVLMQGSAKKEEQQDPVAHAEKLMHDLYMLSSVVVAKQLDVSSFHKPIVLYNPGGEPSPALKVMEDIFQRKLAGGRIGRYDLEAPKDDNGFDPRNFMDVIGDEKTLSRYLDWRRRGYTPLSNPPLPNDGEMDFTPVGNQPSNGDNGNGSENGGKTRTITLKPGSPGQKITPSGRGTDRFKVAVFLSASSENELNLESAHNLSKMLARNNFGVVFGAGDRYMMGAVLEGVEDYRKEMYRQGRKGKDVAWLGGSSTPVILGRETHHGNIPEGFNQFYLAPDIYHRMRYLMQNSDAFVIMEGGPGTVQELAGVLKVKFENERLALEKGKTDAYEKDPMRMGYANAYMNSKGEEEIKQRAKPVIVVNRRQSKDNNHGVWNELLVQTLGDQKQKKRGGVDVSHVLTGEDITNLSRLGIYVVRTEKKALDLVDWFRKGKTQFDPTCPREQEFAERFVVPRGYGYHGRGDSQHGDTAESNIGMGI